MADAVKLSTNRWPGMYKDYFSAIEDAKQKHISDMGTLDDEGIQKTELTAAKIRKKSRKTNRGLSQLARVDCRLGIARAG